MTASTPTRVVNAGDGERLVAWLAAGKRIL
jgi:hypothetical protein